MNILEKECALKIIVKEEGKEYIFNDKLKNCESPYLSKYFFCETFTVNKNVSENEKGQFQHIMDYLNIKGEDSIEVVVIGSEYVNGEKLDDLIGEVDRNDAIRYVFQILSGLKCLHLNRIIYRNLQPKKIVIDSRTNTVNFYEK